MKETRPARGILGTVFGLVVFGVVLLFSYALFLPLTWDADGPFAGGLILVFAPLAAFPAGLAVLMYCIAHGSLPEQQSRFGRILTSAGIAVVVMCGLVGTFVAMLG